MTRYETILGGLAAGCAAWILTGSIRDMLTRDPPVFFGDESVCDREHMTRMHNRIQATNWLSVLSGLGCVLASVAFLKMQSPKVAYGASVLATLVGCGGSLYALHGATIPCSTDPEWKPFVTHQPETVPTSRTR